MLSGRSIRPSVRPLPKLRTRFLKTNLPILLQIGESVFGSRHEKFKFRGQEVKGQGYTTLKLDLAEASFSTPSVESVFSQPSIYIDGWLYGMRMTSVAESVTFRCCLKTIPHIIILSS